jgi:hypothetical protein
VVDRVGQQWGSTLESSYVQERVLVHEPRTDQPAIAEPLLRDLLEKGRKRTLNWLVIIPIYLAFMVWVPLYTGRQTAFIPVIVLFAFRWFALLINWIRVAAPLHRMRNMPFREVRPTTGELLAAGSKVSFILPGDRRWVVSKLPEAERLLLAGVRRIWMLGPDPRGRVFLVLRGSVTGWMGRIRPEPAAGSTALAGRNRQPVAPKHDEVLSACMRRTWRRLVIGSAVLLVLFGSLLWIYVANPVGGDAPAPGVVGGMVGGAVALAVLIVRVAVLTFGMARAVRAPNWTELSIVLDEGIRTTASPLAGTSGRTLLPDGREVAVKLQKVNINLLANVRDTGRLWVLGSPEAGRSAKIGLPGYPLLGTAKLGKR